MSDPVEHGRDHDTEDAVAAIHPERLPTPVPPSRNRRRRVTELKCSEVRWFYRRKEAETKWVPFKGLDSLKLEVRYRELNSIAIDVQAEQKIKDHHVNVNGQVVVLDRLYIASDDVSSISALYWKEDTAELRRGVWFLPDWQPIKPIMADEIEKHHLTHFRGQTIPEGTSMFSDKEASKKPQLTELQLQDNYEVKWSSVIDIFLYSTTKASRILRYIAWGKGTSLRRGYESEADWEDGSPTVSHLILVVHGIGQKGYENLIAENTAQVRDAVYSQLEKHFPDERSRPMFLPIEWRSSLVLDGGVTDQITLPKMSSMREALNSTAMDIMYYQSPLYRKEIIAGVVSQMNSVYEQFMGNNPSFDGPVSIFAHSLGSVICYDILTSWSPLLMYDQYVTEAINTHIQNVKDERARETMVEYQAAREKMHNNVEGGIKKMLVTKDEILLFKVKYLFAIGSPLAVFLVMRGVGKDTVIPENAKVERIYNVFHPYDPVAYRLEPLFSPEYRNIRPVKIFSSHDLRGKNPYDELPLELHKSYLKKLKIQASKLKKNDSKSGDTKSPPEDECDEEEECETDEFDARSGCSSPRSLTPPPGDDGKSAKRGWFWGSSTNNNKKEKDKEQNVEVAKEVEALPVEKLSELDKLLEKVSIDSRPPFRIDYNVQPALTEKSYWSVLKSHFAYWTNSDIALFLVNVMYDAGKVKNAPGEGEAVLESNEKKENVIKEIEKKKENVAPTQQEVPIINRM